MGGKKSFGLILFPVTVSHLLDANTATLPNTFALDSGPNSYPILSNVGVKVSTVMYIL